MLLALKTITILGSIVGLTQDWNVAGIVCLVVGILLMIVEMFTPGLGIAGALGGISLIAAIVLRARSFTEALLLFACIIVILIIIGAILYASFSKGWLSRSSIMLHDKIDSDSTSLKDSADALIGKEGFALSYLRPTGIAEFDGKRIDVMTSGEFIEKDTPVRIVSVEGIKITVQRIN